VRQELADEFEVVKEVSQTLSSFKASDDNWASQGVLNSRCNVRSPMEEPTRDPDVWPPPPPLDRRVGPTSGFAPSPVQIHPSHQPPSYRSPAGQPTSVSSNVTSRAGGNRRTGKEVAAKPASGAQRSRGATGAGTAFRSVFTHIRETYVYIFMSLGAPLCIFYGVMSQLTNQRYFFSRWQSENTTPYLPVNDYQCYLFGCSWSRFQYCIR
ncbi:Katanin p60 subunit A1, partial [Fasciolopsis buskii]